MENNSIKRKINIFGKVGKIISSVIIVLLLIAEGAMLIGTVAVAFIPKETVSADVQGKADVKIDADYFGLDDGDVAVKAGNTNIKIADFDAKNVQTHIENGVVNLNAESGIMHFNLTDAIKLLVIGMVKVAALIVALYFFKALMKAFMTCDTPFADDVIKKMRAFAIALIPTVAVSSIASGILGGMFTDSFSFGNTNLISAAFVLVIFILTAIFKYGAQLQKQYDETV